MDELKHSKVNFSESDTCNREMLDSLNIGDYYCLIVLSDMDVHEPLKADSRTLVTLLNIRDIKKSISQEISVTSQVLNEENSRVVSIIEANDFIVGEKIVSL